MGNGTYSNTTGYRLSDIRFEIIDILTMILLTFIFVVGVVGNSLVVYIFGFKTGKRLKRFEHFLLLLGIVDLISSFFIPLSFLYLTTTAFKRWDFGYIGCKIIPSLVQMSITISQGVLILISYERYHTLTQPFNNRLSCWKIVTYMTMVVMLSIILVSPYSYTLNVTENSFYGVKTCLPNGRRIDLLLAASLIQLKRDVIALGIMLFLGYKINASLTEEHSSLSWERKKLSTKGRRVLRFLVIVFALLTLPVDVFQTFVYSLLMSHVHISRRVYEAIIVINTLLNLLQTSNSVVNVFIYSRMHNNFRLKCIQPKQRKLKRNMSSYYKTEVEIMPSFDRNSSFYGNNRQSKDMRPCDRNSNYYGNKNRSNGSMVFFQEDQMN